LGILLLVFVTSMSSSGGSVAGLALAALVFAVSAFYAVHKLSRLVEKWMLDNKFGYTEITLYALGIGLIVATIGGVLGLSTTIGAYFAGFALSETRSGKKIKKNVGFLRDFFLVFFFVAFGTTLFYDPAANSAILPALDQFGLLLALAIGLGLAAILAHSLSTRIFGALFGLSSEDSSATAILLSPLGEFAVIIATVAVVVLSATEAKMLTPLAFLLIMVTVMLFQPMYRLRKLHERVFGKIPRIPKAQAETRIEPNTPHTIKQIKGMVANLFIILCLAWVTVLLYRELPNFGVPILYSRQITAAIIFVFFAGLPAFNVLKSFARIMKAARVEVKRGAKRFAYK